MQVQVLSNAFDREKDLFQGGGDLGRAKYQFQTVNCGPGGSQCLGRTPTFGLLPHLPRYLPR